MKHDIQILEEGRERLLALELGPEAIEQLG